MNLLGAPSSCSQANELLKRLCPDNGTEVCEDIRYIRAGLIADCYITPVFYLLTVVFIVFGTVLNPLSTYCFFKMYKRDSQNIFLYVLSISDTINLQINFALPMLRQWEIIDDYFRNNDSFCRIFGVLNEFFLIFPAWLLVLLTIDRLIYITRLVKRPLSYTRQRAKLSILALGLCVLILSLYRLFDVKGIDQSGAFAIVTCNVTDYPIPAMKYLNLLVWSIFPLCVTLILSIIMIYKISVTSDRIQKNPVKHRSIKLDRATKTTLFISILFPTVFHTPTGITIALALIYQKNPYTTVTILILVARKLTMILSAISSSCKFFAYIKTFPHFNEILCTLFRCDRYRYRHRGSSIELSHRDLRRSRDTANSNKIRFEHNKQQLSSSESRTTSFSKINDRHPSVYYNLHSAECTSKTFSEYQSMIEVNEDFDSL
ncbi:unnamed protein product [Adineta ricciae]|uniref:G-protein coupled receptors family 1 profile domain-containing protein n=1 Tax=Adineta ricciae TaxID=249248 RepID=A0A814TXX0_ADIRI|nr:unnamed protein product [Adineta ricciae]CAF1294950.1 unnamed protein product [Adineta ricciae]